MPYKTSIHCDSVALCNRAILGHKLREHRQEKMITLFVVDVVVVIQYIISFIHLFGAVDLGSFFSAFDLSFSLSPSFLMSSSPS